MFSLRAIQLGLSFALVSSATLAFGPEPEDMRGRVNEYVVACMANKNLVWANPSRENVRKSCTCSANAVLYDGTFRPRQQALIYYYVLGDEDGIAESRRYLQSSLEDEARIAALTLHGLGC